MFCSSFSCYAVVGLQETSLNVIGDLMFYSANKSLINIYKKRDAFPYVLQNGHDALWFAMGLFKTTYSKIRNVL